MLNHIQSVPKFSEIFWIVRILCLNSLSWIKSLNVYSWYRELCPRTSDPDWKPGPSLVSTSRRITPKLLRMTYKGYPLHYDDKYGWGYLIPDKHKAASDRQKLAMAEEGMSKFPIA